MRLAGALLLLALPCLAGAHGDLHLQIENVTAQIAQAPKNAGLYLHRADLRRDHEEWAAALEDYRHALQLDGGLVDAKLGQAQLYLAWAKPALSLEPIAAFLKSRPGDALGLSVKANALEALGRHGEASLAFALSLKARPDIEVYMEELQSLRRAGRSGDALQVVKQGIVQLGPLPVLEAQGVDLERSLGRFDAALQRNQGMLMGPGRKDALLEIRGDILMQAGRQMEARAAWRQALAEMDKLSDARRRVQAAMDLEARLKRKLGRS